MNSNLAKCALLLACAGTCALATAAKSTKVADKKHATRPATSPFKSASPRDWQVCKKSTECAIYGEDCLGVPYNLKYQQEVLNFILNKTIACKKLFPGYYYEAKCVKQRCRRVTSRRK